MGFCDERGVQSTRLSMNFLIGKKNWEHLIKGTSHLKTCYVELEMST